VLFLLVSLLDCHDFPVTPHKPAVHARKATNDLLRSTGQARLGCEIRGY
jgi:hypothetical protein